MGRRGAGETPLVDIIQPGCSTVPGWCAETRRKSGDAVCPPVVSREMCDSRFADRLSTGELGPGRQSGADSHLAVERPCVHVQAVDLDASPDPFVACLSSDEVARAQRFHLPLHRNRFIVGRGMLRHALGAVLNVAPAAISFDYGTFGKPRVRGRRKPYFSISHSGDFAAIAISKEHLVGVDVEVIRDLDDLPQLIPLIFNEQERRQLDAWIGAEKVHGFFQGWSRKEAYFKAVGAGLSSRLHNLTVDLSDATPCVLDIRGDDHRCWCLQNVATPPGFVGALALRCPDAFVVESE